MRKKAYIQPEILFEFIEQDHLMGDNSIDLTDKGADNGDGDEDYAKRTGGFIFDDADSFNDFDE